MNTAILYGAIVIFAAFLLLLAILFQSVRGFLKLLLHSAAGWVGLYIWNSLVPSLFIGINIASASIAGILGLPGLLLMILLKLIFKL